MQEQAIMRATISIDYESYKAFYKDIVWKSLMPGIHFPLWWCFGLLSMAYFLIARNADFLPLHWVGFLITAAVSVLMLFIYAWNMPVRLYRKHQALFLWERRYAFYRDYLTVEMPNYECKANYAYYVGAFEHKTAFYLKNQEGNYIIFSKKHFSEQQQQTLRELFARNFGKALEG